MVNVPSGHAARGAKFGSEGIEGDVGAVGPPRAPRAEDAPGDADPPPRPRAETPRDDDDSVVAHPRRDRRPPAKTRVRATPPTQPSTPTSTGPRTRERPSLTMDRARRKHTTTRARASGKRDGLPSGKSAVAGRRVRPTESIDESRRIGDCQNARRSALPRSGWCDSWPNEWADSAIGEPNGGPIRGERRGCVGDFVWENSL